MNKLIHGCWYDEGDPEHLIYFKIIDDLKRDLWMSKWNDIRDLDKETRTELEMDVRDACEKFIVIDLSPLEDWLEIYEW